MSLQTQEISRNLDNEAIEILANCAASTRIHSQYFFPEIFFSVYSILHDQILLALDSGKKKIVIAAPRGLGKTSTLIYGFISRHILFELSKFIIYLTNSGDNAVIQTENLKYELLANQTVRDLFGPINYRYEDSLDERFSKKSWVTSKGVFVLPRGAGQQIRGLLYHAIRPQLIVIDDLEDKELIQSDTQRKKLKEWFYSDVMKAGDQYNKTTIFIYIDTLKHEDALLQELLDSPEWFPVHLDICDDNYKSNAPEFMSDEDIAAEVAELKRKGQLDVFYREMRNIPVARETATFKSEYFRYYRELGENIELLELREDKYVVTEILKVKDLVNMVIVDPAKEVQIHNADTAIVGIGVHRDSKKVFIRDIDSDKMYPDEIYKRSFAMARRIKSHMIFYEKTSLHKFIEQPFENQRRVENWVGLLEALNAEGKKEERVAHLAPYYKQGYVYHKLGTCTKLESQLMAFPRPKLWDVMDATAYFIKVMDEYFLYFDSGEDVDQPTEEEYDELEDDLPIGARAII